MLTELRQVLDVIDTDDEIRAVVVTGAGRAFCAGADLGRGGSTFDYATHEDAIAQLDNGVHRDGGGLVTLRMFDCLKPIIGAVNGPAVGVGASLLLPMDARLAVPEARLGFVFARRGLLPDAAASWFLPRLVGLPTALEWCYSGLVFPATEAYEAGLIQSLHDPEELVPAVKALARQMVESSAPVSVALTRQIMWRMAGAAHPMDAHRADSRGLQAQGASGDVREGVESFLEKRPAQFPGRVSTDLPDMWGWWERPAFS
jgi:enoyl-CoA hydratase/carnithine racemase